MTKKESASSNAGIGVNPVPLHSWHIPRATLWCTDPACPYNTGGTMWSDRSSSGRSSDSRAQHSAAESGSGSNSSNYGSHKTGASDAPLVEVVTAYKGDNSLSAPFFLIPGGGNASPSDAASLASSTHFTLIGGERRSKKPPSWCAAHQVSAIVLTMSALILLGIVCAVLYMEAYRRH